MYETNYAGPSINQARTNRRLLGRGYVRHVSQPHACARPVNQDDVCQLVRRHGLAFRLQHHTLVFVQTDTEHFTARPVATNIPLPGGYLATNGFSAGERLVVEGAQDLLSEALLSGSKAAGGGEGDND